MTSPISRQSPVTIEDLRGRVREAESLLGIARGLAREELHDPQTCERARDRIVSILREIDALFPGLHDPPPVLDPSELVAPSMRSVSSSEVALENAESEDRAGEGEHEEDEWDLDYAKLSAALDNQELMGKIPEVDREWFRRMALRSIEAQERASLCDRVRIAFEELAQAMKAGLDETSRQLSVALTFEQLKARQQH
jgi:hypothetical protein